MNICDVRWWVSCISDGWIGSVGCMMLIFFFFFFKQKTAYEIGTGDWSSDVCSSDLLDILLLDKIG